MLKTLQIGDYSAWICIEGIASPVYSTQRVDNSASCWIESKVGKKFSVNWFNNTRAIPLQGVVLIDGKVCDTHIMLDAERFPHKPSGVGISYARTSDWTRRDFQFSSLLISDDDDYLDTIDASMNIGTITLQLWRIEVENVVYETLKHRYGGPTLDNQIVHEKSKKAGAHLVTYGDEYASPAPTVDMVRGRTLDATPIATFSFKYRPYDVLLANDIIAPPNSSNNIPSTSTIRYEPDARTAAQIKRLEIRLQNLKKGKMSATSGIAKSPTKSRRNQFKGPKSRSTNIPPNAEVIDLTDLL